MRGATQHFYRSTARPYLGNVSLGLDDEGWREATALLDSCVEGLRRIGSESEARSGGPTVRATFGLIGFESAT